MTEEILIDIKLDDADNETQVDNLTKSITALKKENEDLIKSNKDLAKAGQENSKEYVNNTKQLEVNKQKIADNTASRKGLIQAMVAEDGAIKALKVRNAELIRQRDLITTTTAEGRAEISRLNAVINQNTKIITENSSVQEKQKNNVGNYTNSIRDAIANSGQFGQATIGLTDSLIGLVNPITAAIAGGTALFKAYTSSTIGARDLAKAQDLVSSAFDIANEAVGTFVSQLTGGAGGKGALESFADAVLFRIAPTLQTLASFAAQGKERLRDLEISAKFAQQFAKEDERRAEIQRRARDEEANTLEVRIKAANQINAILENSAQRSVTVLQAQIDAIKTSTINYDNNREAQLRVAEIEAEIADKREEITGKLTENVMALAELRKQFDDEQELRDRRAIDTESELLSVREYSFQREGELLVQAEVNAKESIARVAQARSDQRKKNESDEKKSAENIKRIDQLKNEAIIGGINLVTSERSVARKALTAIFKADAIKETTINTYDAAVAAYKSLAGIPYVGPILGAAAAAAVTVFGLTNVARIMGVEFGGFAKGGLVKASEWVKGFAKGGLTGTKVMPYHGTPVTRSNGDDRLVTVKTGEVILNQEQQARLGGPATFTRIGVPGFATGGLNTTAPIQSFAESQATRAAARRVEQTTREVTKFVPVLVYQDFEARSAEINEPIARSRVV